MTQGSHDVKMAKNMKPFFFRFRFLFDSYLHLPSFKVWVLQLTKNAASVKINISIRRFNGNFANNFSKMANKNQHQEYTKEKPYMTVCTFLQN